jgi:hypothetical protein
VDPKPAYIANQANPPSLNRQAQPANQFRSPARPSSHLSSLLSPQGGVHTSAGLCFPFFLLPYTPIHAPHLGARGASTSTHVEPCGHPSSGLGCSSKGGFDPFALQPRPRTLGAGHRIVATSPPWLGRHGWPWGNFALRRERCLL